MSELSDDARSRREPDFYDVGRGLIRYERESVEAFAERSVA